MRKFILFLLASYILVIKLSAFIVDAHNLEPFEKAIENIDQHCLVLLDVDETLICSKDMILRPRAIKIWNKHAEEILENYDSDYFLGQVLATMEYELVDPSIVAIISSLQQRNIKTIAFTKNGHGAFRNNSFHGRLALGTT